MIFDFLRGIGVHDEAKGFHDDSDDVGWFFHGLQQIELFLIQDFECLFSGSEHRHGFSEIGLAFSLDFVSGINCLLDNLFFALNAFFEDIGFGFINLNFLHFLFSINGGLLQLRLEIDQIRFHSFNRFFSYNNLFIPIFVLEDIRLDLFSFFVQKFLESGNQFNVRRRSNVVVSFEFTQEFFGPFGSR